MVDKVLDRRRATTASLNPCPAWLIKAARPITTEWATAIINRSLQEDKVFLALKETFIRPIRKKSSLASDDIGNCRPIAKVSFLSKVVEMVVEMVVADQLQVLLDKTNALDPFSGASGRATVWKQHWPPCLFDDLLKEADMGQTSLLGLDISAAFDTVDHGILLGRLSKLGIGGLAIA